MQNIMHACITTAAVVMFVAFAPLSAGFQLPLPSTGTASLGRVAPPLAQPFRAEDRLGALARPTCAVAPACMGLRMKAGGPREDLSGLWTPGQGGAGLWTPGGEILIETEEMMKKKRPWLEAEWEVLLGQSEDLRKKAKSGLLMQESSEAGEELAGVNVTEVGLRAVGEELDLKKEFLDFKALLDGKEFSPADAMPTSRLVSACFRKSKQAWLEALGALAVLGFDPGPFVARQGVNKVVHLDIICLQLAGMMAMEEGKLKEGAYSDEELLGVQNLAVAVCRVVLRYAILEEVIKRQLQAGGFNIIVTSRAASFMDKERILLPDGAVQHLLRSDFTPSLEWQEVDAAVGGQPAKALLVPVEQVDGWLSQEFGQREEQVTASGIITGASGIIT